MKRNTNPYGTALASLVAVSSPFVSSVHGEGAETPFGGVSIASLPFSDTGDTADNVDDFDAVCPYSGSTAPDVFYDYTATASETITIALCESGYDTKTYVLDSGMFVVACNDDACSDGQGNPYRSRLTVELIAGSYAIAVDGFGGDRGDYEIHVTAGVVDPLGACCLPDFTCGMTDDEDACLSAGGEFLGVGSFCGLCPNPPEGACCLGDLSCQIMYEETCVFNGGVFQGEESACEGVCPGACCLSGSSCVELVADACATAGGLHYAQTSCAAVSCDCIGDIDVNGSISIFELNAVLANWGPCIWDPCLGDINGDDAVDCIDLYYVLENWGDCPSPFPGTVELFDELITVDATDDEARAMGLLVTHVYATGPDVLDGDRVLFVSGQADAAAGTTFFQEPLFGDVVPPPESEVLIEPALAYDTFVTMNELTYDDSDPQGGDYDFCLTFSMTDTTFGGGWYAWNHDLHRAVDISSATGMPGRFGVLVAQITLEVPPDGGAIGYAGVLRLYTSAHDGGTLHGVDASVDFSVELVDSACCIPSTGACLELSMLDCDAFAGIWQGLGTTCADPEIQCDAGACCVPATGACIFTNEATCAAGGGAFQGIGSDCSDLDGNGTADVCESDCVQDVNGDGTAGFADLLAVLAFLPWGPDPYEPCPPHAPEDIDENCVVGFSDLLFLLANWGECP